MHRLLAALVFMSLVFMSLAVPSGVRASDKKLDSSSSSNAPRTLNVKGPGELLLVRGWNPTTGELVAWMPTHSVAITLEWLSRGVKGFQPNEAVTMYLPHRPYSPATDDAVAIAGGSVTFNGRKWLPVETDPNINVVRICGEFFFIKTIAFQVQK